LAGVLVCRFPLHDGCICSLNNDDNGNCAAGASRFGHISWQRPYGRCIGCKFKRPRRCGYGECVFCYRYDLHGSESARIGASRVVRIGDGDSDYQDTAWRGQQRYQGLLQWDHEWGYDGGGE